jgi:hypothetical protein
MEDRWRERTGRWNKGWKIGGNPMERAAEAEGGVSPVNHKLRRGVIVS